MPGKSIWFIDIIAPTQYYLFISIFVAAAVIFVIDIIVIF